MKRSKVIRLVLLGGGVATMIAACGEDQSRREACERARAELRPDAEQICQRSTRTGSTGARGYWGPVVYGRTRSDPSSSVTRTSSSSRSGFGSTGARSSS
ncbi:hypothetical protein [Falsiroseomonas sp.]|uniref:hypothetical protein n=1 Tax=Falsiroseomonas sp. TaxID=2870721 RepID=UPI0035639514